MQRNLGQSTALDWRSPGAEHALRIPRLAPGLNPGRQFKEHVIRTRINLKLLGDGPRALVCHHQLGVLQYRAALHLTDSFSHRGTYFRLSRIAYFSPVLASFRSLCHFLSSMMYSLPAPPWATSVGVFNSELSYTNHSSTTLR